MTPRERSGSYRSRTDASEKTLAAPRLDGWSGFPSTLIGRPSWLRTSTPAPYPPSGAAVAKKSGTPGVTSSGCVVYG